MIEGDGEEKVTEGRRPGRGRVLRMLVEMAGVIFAVIVALGADAWWEERELAQRAELARSAVIEELRSNRAELEASSASLDSTAVVLSGAADAIAAGQRASFDLRLLLPDFTDAAWRITLATDAASRLDLEWLIRIARVHESQATYRSIAGQVLQAMADLNTVGGQAVPRLHAQVGILIQLHEQLREDYDEVLAENAGERAGG